MSIVYRTSDKLKVKIGGLVFMISPLNKHQKEKIQTLSLENKLMQSAAEAIKCSVKGVSGLKDINDNDYALEFDSNLELIDDCVDDLMNIEQIAELSSVCASLLSGIPKEFMDPYTGKRLKGVSWIKEGTPGKKS